jgi:hypothetical protein
VGVHNVHTLGFGSGRTGADRAGFCMFPREPSICKRWNPVRVPPRARVIPAQGRFWASDRVDTVNSLFGDCWRVSAARYVVIFCRSLWAGYFLSMDGVNFFLAYSFIAGTGSGYMTWLVWGSGTMPAWCLFLSLTTVHGAARGLLQDLWLRFSAVSMRRATPMRLGPR